MRELLLALLDAHRPADGKEREDLIAMREWARTLPDPFSRRALPGHFTGSAVVTDPAGARTLLVAHGRLRRWLQPGGHAEPADAGRLEATALREALEETGLAVDLHPAAPRPLDVDVHPIPPKKGEPAHLHLDVRFLVVARDPGSLRHDPAESDGARWMPWEDALDLAGDPALARLLRKAREAAATRLAPPPGEGYPDPP